MFHPAQDHIFKDRHSREILGEKLALARLLKGMTQAEALRESGLLNPSKKNRTHEGGVTRGFLTYVEAGTRGINKDQLAVLAKLYSKPLKDFLDKHPISERERNTLNTLREGARRHAGRLMPSKKVTPLIRENRKPLALAPTTRRKASAAASVAAPKAAPVAAPAITSGDIAILDAVRDCSEPEKIWLRDAVLRLKERLRPQQAVTPPPPANNKRLAATH